MLTHLSLALFCWRLTFSRCAFVSGLASSSSSSSSSSSNLRCKVYSNNSTTLDSHKIRRLVSITLTMSKKTTEISNNAYRTKRSHSKWLKLLVKQHISVIKTREFEMWKTSLIMRENTPHYQRHVHSSLKTYTQQNPSYVEKVTDKTKQNSTATYISSKSLLPEDDTAERLKKASKILT